MLPCKRLDERAASHRMWMMRTRSLNDSGNDEDDGADNDNIWALQTKQNVVANEQNNATRTPSFLHEGMRVFT